MNLRELNLNQLMDEDDKARDERIAQLAGQVVGSLLDGITRASNDDPREQERMLTELRDRLDKGGVFDSMSKANHASSAAPALPSSASNGNPSDAEKLGQQLLKFTGGDVVTASNALVVLEQVLDVGDGAISYVDQVTKAVQSGKEAFERDGMTYYLKSDRDTAKTNLQLNNELKWVGEVLTRLGGGNRGPQESSEAYANRVKATLSTPQANGALKDVTEHLDALARKNGVEVKNADTATEVLKKLLDGTATGKLNPLGTHKIAIPDQI